MQSILEAALAYASWGWPILPIRANSKLPATAHGVTDATTDEATIRRWFAGNSGFNLAVATGARSGLVVYDIDPRNGGDDSFAAWTAERGSLPHGTTQLTAGGGSHHLAVYDPTIKSSKLAAGVDLLSDGRYFLVYPSTIDGRDYRWELSSDPFDGIGPAAIPASWLTQVRAPQAVVGAELIPGDRNAGLAGLAGAMRHHGMSAAEILAALVVANEERCSPPLPASEVRHIAESIGRYEPEHDTAANASLADEVSTDILALVAAQRPEYYVIRGTSFLTAPAPLEWAIRKWVPASGTTMVYGESGAGKTFVTLDMACCIATGRPWLGQRTRQGVVVYMAGEGNYGIRQRVAAWARHHGVTALDNLLVSNKSIDLDGPNAAAQVLAAVRGLTHEDAVLVVIDTTNNHMAGDENSARDVRNFFGAANVVAAALRSAVVLNHHVGHGDGAKGRARGSSAIKASLDAAILVAQNEAGEIGISCEKMKDAEAPAPLGGKLAPVNLGWVDEDGCEVVGAVFVQAGIPAEPRKPSKPTPEDKYRKTWEGAWWDSGCEQRGGMPYVTRAALRRHLVEAMGMTEASADQYLKPTGARLIAALLADGTISTVEHGWAMGMSIHSDALRLASMGRK